MSRLKVIKAFKNIFSFLCAASIGVVYFFGIKFVFLILGFGLIIIVLEVYFNKVKHLEYIETRLKNWDQKNEKEYDKESYQKLVNSNLYNSTKIQKLTQQTNIDLNIEDIFKKIDYTFTNSGEEFLYNNLNNICLDLNELEDRKKSINALETNEQLRESILRELIQIGYTKENHCMEILDNTKEESTKQYYISIVFGFSNLIFLLSIFSNPSFIIALIFSLLFSSIYYYYQKDYVTSNLNGINYANNLISSSTRLLNLNIEELEINKTELKQILTSTKKAHKKMRKIMTFNSSNGVMLEQKMMIDYLNIFTQRQYILFYQVKSFLKDNREDIKQLYYLVGKLDTYISIVAMRSNYKCSTPQFEEQGGLITNSYYPLIDNPVKNNINISEIGIIVTGSNMAGKSTFIRSIAFNVLVAQSIVTTFADEYQSKIFKIFTSISVSDKTTEGKSQYLSEINALKDMVDGLNEETPSLCIVDEILSGTNATEKISISVSILDFISKNNGIPITTTHDIEIAKMMDQFKQYHFSEDIIDNKLVFNYLLHTGISKTTNAIELLKYVGYNDKIYNDSIEIAKNISKLKE